MTDKFKTNASLVLACLTLVAVIGFGVVGRGQAVPAETQGIHWFGDLGVGGDITAAGTAGQTYAVGTDDTTADNIDVGSAKDDVDIEGEDITLDTSDDANAAVADDFTFTMESASGLWTVTGTPGIVIAIGTDDTTADNIDIGSAKDDVDVVGATIGLTGDTTLTAGSDTLTFDGDTTLSSEATGGNALAKNEFIGLPRIKNVGIGTMANGTTNTVLTDIGDSETPATDWTAIDGDTTMSNDSTYYRQGTASLKMAIADTAIAADGCTNALGTGDQDWSDDESVGMWIYTDTAFDADDLVLQITDNGTDSTVAFPAVASADAWTWIELNISGVANADKDIITDLSIELNTASDLIGVASNIYFDFIVKWDGAEEETLGVEIPYDGVLSLTVIDATDAGASCANITEYTDYFVHYQSGDDAIVIITDQSGADKVGLALVAYE